MTHEEKIREFAALVEKETQARCLREYPALKPYIVKVVSGKKYTKVDVGPDFNMSGKYMVDADGNIYGIKAYGVIHKGHRYGTLDTINEWYWGDYRGIKK